MSQQTASPFPAFTEDTFVSEIKAKGLSAEQLSKAIRTTFTALFGELSATTALCYVGDASNGDLRGFVRRADELFGPNASTVLSRIVSTAIESH